jgi:hypothetical protein
LSGPLLKKVSRILAAEERTPEACLEEALEAWLRLRQNPPERKRGHPVIDTEDQKL